MISFSSSPSREEYLKKKRNKRLLKYGLVLFLVLLIFGIFIYISRRPELNISEVELKGGVLITQDEVGERVFEYLQGSYLWVFPVRNAFLYPRSNLETYLKETFKRIETISISLKNFHTLSIEIIEHKPIATWCHNVSGAEIKMEDGTTNIEKCYFLDENSKIFAEAPSFSGDAYFRYYGLIQDDNPIGKYYISSSSEFADISKFIENAKKLSLLPQHLVAKENQEFSLVLSGGVEIYFDLKKPLSTITDNLEALLNSEAFEKFSRDRLPLEYIDLRYGNKLYYKLRTQ